jgi:hypothetical protein
MTAIVTATRVFIGTNLDDLIVLTVLMPAHRAHGKPRSRQIWAGQVPRHRRARRSLGARRAQPREQMLLEREPDVEKRLHGIEPQLR